MTACPKCGRENTVGVKFCPECGAALVAQEVPVRGVRKMVTVLFADVAGSTALGEEVDPETLPSLMDGYFAVIGGIIEAHGGTVEKFIGDAVMAVFGIPVIHGRADALLALGDALVASGDRDGARAAAVQAQTVSAAKENLVGERRTANGERRAASFLARLQAERS